VTFREWRPLVTSPDDQYAIDSSEAVWREVGDDVIILDVRTSTYLSLNGSGRLLWLALEGGAKLSDLVALLVDEFAIEESRAVEDVDAFLASLDERQLLQKR